MNARVIGDIFNVKDIREKLLDVHEFSMTEIAKTASKRLQDDLNKTLEFAVPRGRRTEIGFENAKVKEVTFKINRTNQGIEVTVHVNVNDPDGIWHMINSGNLKSQHDGATRIRRENRTQAGTLQVKPFPSSGGYTNEWFYSVKGETRRTTPRDWYQLAADNLDKYIKSKNVSLDFVIKVTN